MGSHSRVAAGQSSQHDVLDARTSAACCVLPGILSCISRGNMPCTAHSDCVGFYCQMGPSVFHEGSHSSICVFWLVAFGSGVLGSLDSMVKGARHGRGTFGALCHYSSELLTIVCIWILALGLWVFASLLHARRHIIPLCAFACHYVWPHTLGRSLSYCFCLGSVLAKCWVRAVVVCACAVPLRDVVAIIWSRVARDSRGCLWLTCKA